MQSKTCRGPFWLWIAMLAVALLGTAAAGQAQDAVDQAVLSGCEYDYAPFCIVRGDGQADGFSVRLLRAALKAMGRDVSFKTAPWVQIKDDLAEGRLQCLPMVARSPERETTFDFTTPYLTMHGTIVVRQDNADIYGPDDLKGKRVAVLQEDIAHEYLRDANLGAVIVPLPSFATAMRELSQGKHDAVVIQKLLAFQIMKELGLANLRAVGPPLAGFSQAFCFAVREGDKDLLNLLNEGLSIVIADGTFRQLHSQWFSPLEALGRARSRIVVGGDTEYPPYEFLDANGQPAGYNVDLTRAIARHMGLSVEIRLRPWAEVRAGLEQGGIDLVQGMFYSAERDTVVDFSPPHTLIQHVIVVRKGSPRLSDMQALAGKSVLVMGGDIMHDLAGRQAHAASVVPVATQEEALRRLAAGEHDCALVARVPALYWIRKNGWDNLLIGEQPVLSAEYCFAVPGGNESLLAEFAEGLAALKQTGEYRAIQARWLAPYEQTQVGLRTILKYVLLGAIPLLVLLGGSLLWTRSLQREVRRRTRELRTETRFLHLIGEGKSTAQVVREATKFLKELSGCQAVGVRLKDGENYPYYEAHGFPLEFIRQENPLCAYDAHGNLRRDPQGRVLLDCMCGNIIQGRVDPSKPFFTRGGSFWTNSTTQLLAATTDEDRLARTRNYCNTVGYESVALVPLRVGTEPLGLVQFSDRRAGMFRAENLAMWERLADALAVAVAKARAEGSLRELNEHLEQRVSERAAEAQHRSEQLRALTAQLTRAEQKERQRLATVLHDGLQQLLVGTKFHLSILGSQLSDPRLREIIRQVDDLLDESLDASRSLTVDLSPPILQKGTMAQVLQWLGHWFGGKHGLAVEVRADERANPTASEVRVLLFQAVRELLFNVVKHARVSRACVELRIADDGQIQVVVNDEGAGFDPSGPRSSGSEGSGFGLFSIRERLDWLGGKLEIRSAPGQGTRAIITSPMELKTGPADASKTLGSADPATSSTSAGTHERLRVLLADDHVVMRDGLARLLGTQPWIEVVGQAADGQQVVEMTRQLRPDVIVMDINMPRMDGVEATRQILGEQPAIQVIGLSMFSEDSVARAMEQAGAANYLTKTSGPEALLAAIRAASQANPRRKP